MANWTNAEPWVLVYNCDHCSPNPNWCMKQRSFQHGVKCVSSGVILMMSQLSMLSSSYCCSYVCIGKQTNFFYKIKMFPWYYHNVSALGNTAILEKWKSNDGCRSDLWSSSGYGGSKPQVIEILGDQNPSHPNIQYLCSLSFEFWALRFGLGHWAVGGPKLAETAPWTCATPGPWCTTDSWESTWQSQLANNDMNKVYIAVFWLITAKWYKWWKMRFYSSYAYCSILSSLSSTDKTWSPKNHGWAAFQQAQA